MAHIKTRLIDRHELEIEDKPLNSGGEKTAFFSRDHQLVACFFFGRLKDRVERRKRLEKILKDYNPTAGGPLADYWKQHFCWPVGVLDGDSNLPRNFLRAYNLLDPPLAVVAPAYRQNFYFQDRTGSKREKEGKWFTSPKARRLVPDTEKGSWFTTLQVCAKMARSVRRMHFAGLAHSDLSNKNVLIDPKAGDSCIIDIDSLVVPGVAPPAVLGTPGYIAPEVVAGGALPSMATDRHALGVLIYETLLLRSPLDGPKVRSTRSSEEDEFLSKGSQALFVEHPTDLSNHLHPAPAVPMSRLGPYLGQLFLKTFVTGLHAPPKRTDANEWEKALYLTLDLLHPSPGGKEWFVLGPGMPMQCPFTGRKLGCPVPYARFYKGLERHAGHFASENRTLTIWDGRKLHSWHTKVNVIPGEFADPTPEGYFCSHQGKWYLVNQSGEPTRIALGPRIRKGQSVEIQRGLAVSFGEGPGTRLFEFDFMTA